MSWARSILDAAVESLSRASLRVLGRERPADEDHLLPQDDRDRAVARCHDLRRNNAVARGTMLAMLDNVVGGALHLQARTSDSKWNTAAEAWFRAWSKRADASGRRSFTGIMRECVRARLFDGELLLVPHVSGGFALVESERIRPAAGEDQAYGLDPDGRVLWWNVADRDPKTGDFPPGAPSRRVSNAIYVTVLDRVDQVRGWPEFATVANPATDLGEINSANLKKYKMGAMAAWTLTGGGRLRGRSQMDSPLKNFREGEIYELDAGQQIQPFNNSQPGGEYAPFVKVNLQQISMALRLPYEFLLMYFADSTFASSRTAILQAAKTLNAWRDWLEEQALAPALSWAVAEAIRRGELPRAPVDKAGRSEWDRWQWLRPGYDWVDPLSAIQYHMQAIRLGIMSYTDVAAMYGFDWEEALSRKATDLALLFKKAKEAGVDWRLLSDNQISGQAPLPADGDGKGGGSDE